jgi:hypothetical protein
MTKNKLVTRTIPLAVATLLMAFTAHASDNSIYLDQAGDNSTIAMLQDGAGNRIRGVQGLGTGNTTPSIIKGDAVNVDIRQIGSGNILNMGVDTTTANGASPTSIIYKVTGNNAVGTINLNNSGNGISASQTVNIDQTGDGAITNLNLLGARNSLQVIQAGGNNNKFVATINAADTIVTINQTGGGGNETTLNMTGDKGQVDITSIGSTNITNITQSGGGANGHYAKLDITGSGNTTTINQSGTIDTTVNLKSVGSGNTFNITTRN